MTSSRDVDGGWAWIVLCASYFNQLVCAGLAFVAGMFQVIFLEEFNGSVAFTAWVTGLFSALLQLAGPLASSVSNAWGCRTCVMIGGGLLAIGFLISGLVNSLEWLMVFFGAVAGLGMGMTYIPSIVVINYFFVKKRTLVNGIASSAGGLGIVLAPQISQFLFENYSWREALFILAGISAHICIAGALMFPVYEKPRIKNSMCCCKDKGNGYDVNSVKQFQSGEKDVFIMKCEVDFEHEIETKDTVEYNNYTKMYKHGTNTQENGEDFPGCLHGRDRKTENDIDDRISHENELNGKTNIVEKDNNMFERQNTHTPNLKSPKYPRLYKNGLFLVVCLNLFVSSAGSGCFLIHLPSFLHSRNLSGREVTNVLSTNGMAILFGRCLVGALVNNQPGNEVLFLMVLQVIGGIFIMLYPVVGTSYASCVGIMFALASYSGTFYTLLPTLTIQYVGLDRLSTAFGIEMVCCGIGYLISPPLSGMIVDLTGNYDINMYGGGALLILAGLICMVLPGRSKDKSIKLKEIDKSDEYLEDPQGVQTLS